MPFGEDRSIIAYQSTPESITLEAIDPDSGPDPLSYAVIESPSHGELTGTAPNLTYTADSDYVGYDSIVFRVYDGLFYSPEATVTIEVLTTE